MFDFIKLGINSFMAHHLSHHNEQGQQLFSKMLKYSFWIMKPVLGK